ncbi:DMT family transporter [Photobacterium lipolyticum]|uniref:EamA family transporter n=1 Tax=Photobacterium lipolyticum TaxID=266810 RepID=A0A2T3N0P9_9GAMM|nr:EamA family transporter [Photobacterium lipolyticum]PSW05726.1 EamA family transporter [Photobacterium lipolyticum]
MKPNYLAHLKLLAFTALISLSFPIGSYITAELNPLVVTWMRYLLASLLFIALLVCKGQFRLPTLKGLGRYTLICLPSLTYFVTMFIALRDTSALDTSALYTTVPLMSAILAAIVFKRSTSLSISFALMGGMLGAGLIIFRGDLSAVASISLTSSNKIYLFGCFAMALNPIAAKALYRGESFISMTCWTLICATALLTLGTGTTLLATDWNAISSEVWLGIAYLAVFATALSFFLFQQACVALTPVQVSAYTYLIPVMVLVVNHANGHTESWSQVSYGVVAVILAMAVMIRSSSPVSVNSPSAATPNKN